METETVTPTRAILPITRPAFDDAELRRVAACLESGWVTQGPLTQEFERRFAARHEVGHALATTSCTAALHMAALAIGLGPGDEVLVPSFTWITSASCAEYAGARPVFVDVEPETFNVDPEALAAAVTPRTRAIVVVHLFGLAARMDEVMAIARRHDLRVIEDAACAIGSTYADRPVGGIGDIACFSFHPRKVITTGEGGMVTTNDDALADKVRVLRNHGASGGKPPGPAPAPPKPWTMGVFDEVGFNLRLSDIQAAVGVAQMDKLETLLDERGACAARYLDALADVDDLALPRSMDGCRHTYQSFVVRVREGGVERRNAVMEQMAEEGVQTRPGTHAVHRLGYYRTTYGLHESDCPHSAAAEDTSITLPIFPGMTSDDQDRVVRSLRAALLRPARVS
jgi:dTDP-4-amino-4,6-dideoxygalactose transaminase